MPPAGAGAGAGTGGGGSDGDWSESESDAPPVKRRKVNRVASRPPARTRAHSRARASDEETDTDDSARASGDMSSDLEELASDDDCSPLSALPPAAPLPLLSAAQYAAIVETDLARFVARDAALSQSLASARLPAPVRSAIRQLAFRRFLQASLFISDIDAPFYSPHEFLACGHGVGALDESAVASSQPMLAALPLVLPLRPWRSVRRALGRPRRLSLAFFAGERAKLDGCRAWVRLNQRGNRSLAPPSFVDPRLPWMRRRLAVGDAVFAVHPVTHEIHSGLVVGYDDAQAHALPERSVVSMLESEDKFHWYKIKFVDSRLGSQIVPDVHCMRAHPLHPQDADAGAGDGCGAVPLTRSRADLSRALASVLQLLDRKHELILQLDRMNAACEMIVHAASASRAEDANGSHVDDRVAELCTAFQRNYAEVVIQLEATSKSLEGALMTARLHHLPHRPTVPVAGHEPRADWPSLLNESITVAHSILSSLASVSPAAGPNSHQLLLLALLAAAYIVTNPRALLARYSAAEMVDSVNMLMQIVYRSFVEQGVPSRLLAQVVAMGGQLQALIHASTT